jgi:small subunit ribosomal protein S5
MAEEVKTTTTAAAPTAPDRGAPHGGGDRRGGPRRDNRRPDAPKEEKQFEENVISIDRVARVVKGGRRFRFKALVVVGDRKNKVGVGVAKGADVQVAVTKATEVAKKHLLTVPIVNSTIPHDIEVKLDGARVLLKRAAPGTGIIAGGVVRSVVAVTGITDLLSKSLGSTNKVNIAYATIEALRQLVPKDQWVTTEKTEKKPAMKKAVEVAEAPDEVKPAKTVKTVKAEKETKK